MKKNKLNKKFIIILLIVIILLAFIIGFGIIRKKGSSSPTQQVKSYLNKYRNLVKKNIKTNGGILAFNPNSFASSTTVCVDGEYLYLKDIINLKENTAIDIENMFNNLKIKNTNIFQ